jgi:hypothetical protein
MPLINLHEKELCEAINTSENTGKLSVYAANKVIRVISVQLWVNYINE